jgi:hypothetical protein
MYYRFGDVLCQLLHVFISASTILQYLGSHSVQTSFNLKADVSNALRTLLKLMLDAWFTFVYSSEWLSGGDAQVPGGILTSTERKRKS